MKTIWKIILFTLALLICGCCPAKFEDVYTGSDTPSLTVRGESQLKFDPMYMQQSFSRSRGEFRVGTDNMSEYFVLKVSQIPSEENQNLTADVKWTSGESIKELHRRKFTVKKMEAGTIWLWCSQDNILAVVRIPD